MMFAIHRPQASRTMSSGLWSENCEAVDAGASTSGERVGPDLRSAQAFVDAKPAQLASDAFRQSTALNALAQAEFTAKSV